MLNRLQAVKRLQRYKKFCTYASGKGFFVDFSTLEDSFGQREGR